MKTLPAEFRHNIEALLGDQGQAFFHALEERTPVSFLANKQKTPIELIRTARPIPWCPYGHYLEERPEFIFEPAFHAGAYYVMEASSMMLWQTLETLFETRDGLRVLDLCGAPGGKSMVAANFIDHDSLLVINEVNRNRFQVLKENVAKWGMPNVYTTNYDPARMPVDGFFDCVIVDAPCSGEGLFRKTPEAIDEWSMSNVLHCSKRQKRILTEAARMVRPGGFLIYSTCTYNSEENIYNVDYLANNLLFTSLRLNLMFNTSEQKYGESYGYQCFPHKVEGEGFFISALKKENGPTRQLSKKSRIRPNVDDEASKREYALWKPYLRQPENFALFVNDAGTYYGVPREITDDYTHVMQILPHGSPALILGQIKGKDMVPHHSLALSNFVSEDLPRIELSNDMAISYLRKDVIDHVSGDITGWHLASHHGHNLGWFKQTSRHLKNYFPTNLRIRKRG